MMTGAVTQQYLFSVLPASCRRKGKRSHKKHQPLAEPPHAMPLPARRWQHA